MKVPVHMRVRIVDMDQKELVILYQKERATKAQVEHSSRHGGSLLYDLKSLRIVWDLFISVGNICVHPGDTRVCLEWQPPKEVSASSEDSSWDTSRPSKASQEMLLGPTLSQYLQRL